METHERLEAAERCKPRAGPRGDHALLPHEAAGKPSDHDVLGARVDLLVAGPGDARDVAGELDGHVLETPAGAEDRHPLLAGKADRRCHGVVVAVRRPGQHPDAVELVDARALGREPADLDIRGREGHRRVDLTMGEVCGLAVSECGDRRRHDSGYP